MKRRLLRLGLIGAALAAAGFLVAASGVIPIKASSGHWRVTEWLLRFSMKRSIATHSLGTQVPSNLSDRALIQKGAGHYDFACRSCHGEPQGAPPRAVAHMLPAPPDLTPRIRASDPAKLFEVVQHGMKFTGMPAWPTPEREDEVWAMVAFLVAYPTLDVASYRQLAGRAEVPRPTPAGSPAPPAVAHSCVRCHGGDGLGRDNPTLPNLAGQRAPYLHQALAAYAAGRRHSGTMEPFASELSPKEIADLARYYAELPRQPASPPPPPDRLEPETPDWFARGERIARHGIPGERVPACVECHGPNARRGKPEFPLLAGQPAAYLELQLTLMRENRRGGADHAHLMQPIAARLTPAQAHAVARYFAALPPDRENPPAPEPTP